jgi:hypothetical protein
MTVQSRFSGFGRGQAAIVLIALLTVIVLTCLPRAPIAPHVLSQSDHAETKQIGGTDLVLYQTIAVRVASGESYYQVAAQEQRAGNYPLKPFVTIRLPTLAYLLAWLGQVGSSGLLISLLGITLWAYWQRLEGVFADPRRRVRFAEPIQRSVAVSLVAGGSAVVFQPGVVVFHELWAGLLIALAVALKASDRWPWAVLAGAAAVMIRELALPLVLLMTAFAFFERRWREMIAWTAVLLAFSVAMILHASHVGAVVRPDDLSSPGWVNIGGYEAYLRFMRMTSALRLYPDWLANIQIILALFGWLSWRSATGILGTLLLVGYASIFMVLGRADNFYWGLLNAPMLMVGLMFLPQAFSDLGTILVRPKAR